MATVHTLGGAEMMAAAARRRPGAMLLVGVTVLTSHSMPTSYPAQVVGRPVALERRWPGWPAGGGTRRARRRGVLSP